MAVEPEQPQSSLPLRWRALPVALAVIAALSFQGSRGLYESTEGRYAESALEMLERHELLEPTLDGRPHWTKPPLTYWAIAAGIAAAGRNEWGARLPNAAAFCLTVASVAGIGAALWGPATGVAAGLVYASSPFTVGGAAALSTDTLLTLWEVLAVLFFVRAWRARDERGARLNVRLMWLAWAVAFLTKGPAAIVALAPIAAFAWIARPRVRIIEPIGLALFAAMASWWYAWACFAHPGLLQALLHEQVVGRLATTDLHRNPQWYKPFTMYLPFLVLGQGAWLVVALRGARRERLLSVRAARDLLGERGAGALLILWFTVPFVVFSVARSRLPLYVLPIYAPLALAIGRSVVVGTSALALRRPAVIAAASVAVLVAAKGLAAYAAPESDKDMRALYTVVAAEAGTTPDVHAFGEGRLYGLEFYLGRQIRHATARGTEAWADERLDDLLREIEAEGARPHVLLARARAAPELDAALEAARLPHQHRHAPGREVFVVTAHGRP